MVLVSGNSSGCSNCNGNGGSNSNCIDGGASDGNGVEPVITMCDCNGSGNGIINHVYTRTRN